VQELGFYLHKAAALTALMGRPEQFGAVKTGLHARIRQIF